MYFFDSSASDVRKVGILKAYSSAVAFIQVMTDVDKSIRLIGYMTGYHQRMFLIANCIMLKVLRSSYSQDVDFEAGKSLCNQTQVMISKLILSHKDSAGKSAQMVSQLWHSSNTDALNEPPELLVKSRLGARYVTKFRVLVSSLISST